MSGAALTARARRGDVALTTAAPRAAVAFVSGYAVYARLALATIATTLIIYLPELIELGWALVEALNTLAQIQT